MKKLYWGGVIEEGDEPGYGVFFPDVPAAPALVIRRFRLRKMPKRR